MKVVYGFRALLAALCSFAIVACASYGPADSPADVAATPAAASDYQLGPGDKLRITVFGEEQLTGEYDVGAQGGVAFPLIGEVQAVGLTTDELTAALSQRLQQGYLRSPNVSVQVANYRPFFILGEVQQPGTYAYSANLTVMSAVATAGGFTYRARTSRIFIKHSGQTGEQEYPLTSGTPVMPGDTVRVAERYF